jgi:septal ring factor EnvC (AmiA/AmiB activator)
VVAIIAVVVFLLWSSRYHDIMDRQASEISQLKQQIEEADKQNADLRAQLAKVQAEENSLAAQNDELRKEIATAKATGKLPTPPPPPK